MKKTTTRRLGLCLATAAAAVLISAQAHASNVSVVDSGTYFDHDLIRLNAWSNAQEKDLNRVDDDRNGKVDDILGWNFAENYSKVFYPEHIGSIHPIVYKIMTILAKVQLGSVTDEDKQFLEEKVKKLPEAQRKALLEHVNFYGQYAHGTHVSGVISAGNKSARIMAARVFPDSLPPEVPELPGLNLAGFNMLAGGRPTSTWNVFYHLLSTTTNQTFLQVSAYLKETAMDVANLSLGVPLHNIAKQYLAMTGRSDATPEKIEEETWKAFAAFNPKGKQWIGASPSTLFVIAAGNDGSDNDRLPTFPANVEMENAITVAATKRYQALADFSNFGATTVHVAAPGVAIMSAVPGPQTNMVLPMSGTSMAAPYVSMVASNIKDHNPALRPAEIKAILMETVDKKPWLAGKVVSAGVVNADRAYRAARYSKTMALADAVKNARAEVGDVQDRTSFKRIRGTTPEPWMTEIANDLVF